MKKTLAVFLAVIMMFSCFALAFGVYAEETTKAENSRVCTCPDCTKEKGNCHCCIYCQYLDKRYLTKCVVLDENGNIDYENSLCCEDCKGIWPCTCGHDCCDPNETVEDFNHDPILTPDQQNKFVMVFQNLIKRFADAFDKLFDAIFEFLRIKDVFPDIEID